MRKYIIMNFKKIFNISYLLPASAFIVSLCAIAISIIEVRVMDEQKKASVWPIVYSSRSTHSPQDTSKSTFTINITNSGVGPALIKYVEVMFDGKIVKHWSEAVNKLKNKINSNSTVSLSVLTNSVVLPGRESHPLTIYGPLADVFNSDVKRLRLKVCYCSIYEDCWLLDELEPRTAGLAIPHKVEECEINIKRQFLK